MVTYVDTVTLVTTCPLCLSKNYVDVKKGDLALFEEGEVVQHAFPNLTADQRELLVSGICSRCWEEKDFEILTKGMELGRQNRKTRRYTLYHNRVPVKKSPVSTCLS